MTQQGITYNTAAIALLVELFDAAFFIPQIHLFTSDDTPAVGDNPAAQYTEAFGPNYTPQACGPGFIQNISTNPLLFALIGLEFDNVGPLSPGSDTVFGWWIDQASTSAPIPLFGGRFETPLVLNMAGQDLIFDQIQLPLHDCGVTIPVSGVTLLDFFEDAAPVNITLHAPLVGGPWQEFGGTWVVSNRQAVQTVIPAWTFSAVGVQCGTPDGYLRATVITGGNSSGIAFRISDQNNFYWLEADAFSGAFTLGRWQGGVFTQLHTIALPIAANTANRLEVSMNADTFTCLLNGSHTFTSTGNSFNDTATIHGLWQYNISGSGASAIVFSPAIPF